MMEEKRTNHNGSSAAFKTGAIALAFLIIGYQAAIFLTRASVLRIEAARDRPDTVFIAASPSSGNFGITDLSGDLADYSSGGEATAASRKAAAYSGQAGTGSRTTRHNAEHSEAVKAVREATRRVESFRFNPNTVSEEDLVRLGFSSAQARSIANYREKGGRFRRKSDFAKSFVVSDSVYRRLERYIDIPLLDINAADSASFDALPGIGPYFAAKMVSYRKQLGGYSYKEQLMDIYHFDQEKFDALSDLITLRRPEPYGLWSLPADSLRLHPYIKSWQTARSIVRYRETMPRSSWTVQALKSAGILTEDQASRLGRCLIAAPSGN